MGGGTTVSVQDVIKSSVIESFRGNGLEIGEVCFIILASFLIGIYIFFVYKSFSKSAFYSKDMNITMAGMCVVVAAIMIAMQSNLLVSLGMVGALSIVRFRTAIKNPMDLLYLFWSISAGIICGVGLYMLALVLGIVMTFMIWILGHIPASKAPLLLIIKADQSIESKEVEKTIKENCGYYHLSSVFTRNGEREYIYEIRLKKLDNLIGSLTEMTGIKTVNCLESDAEIRG